jgi:hypothetical protein
MTVLPTVRRQLEQAAQRQARARSRPTFAPLRGIAAAKQSVSARRRGRLSGGAVAAASVIVTLCIVVLAVLLLGHRRPVRHSPAVGSAGLVDRYRLDGDGIGPIKFGQTPDRVVAGLERLLGQPEGASTGQRPNGLLRGICGFDHEVDWVGLAQRATASPYTHSAGLTVYFKRARFVGYSYGPPWGDRITPLVRHGVMLSTSAGLGLDESLARGQRLYGQAFIVTSQQQGTPPNPRLERLPAWRVSTTTGRVYGSIGSSRGLNSTDKRTIGSISAGLVPNTPCRSRSTRSSHRRTG